MITYFCIAKWPVMVGLVLLYRRLTMRILNIRARITTACVASEAQDAEMELLTQDGKNLFLHINEYEGEHYTVAESSIFDYLTTGTEKTPEVLFIEEYSSWKSTQKSKYKEYFSQLRKVIKMLK